MTDTLPVAVRPERGTASIRRLRDSQKVPAVLYGHGEANVSLSLKASDIVPLVERGVQTIALSGDLSDTVLIKEVQWDAFGRYILHLDFQRVSARERVEVTVSVELRGEAPGAKQGGVVEQLLHEINIECPATSIPTGFEVNINELKLNDSIRVDSLDLPRGAKVLEDSEAIIVHCIEMMAEEAPEEGAEVAEPEVISREDEEEQGEE